MLLWYWPLYSNWWNKLQTFESKCQKWKMTTFESIWWKICETIYTKDKIPSILSSIIHWKTTMLCTRIISDHYDFSFSVVLLRLLVLLLAWIPSFTPAAENFYNLFEPRIIQYVAKLKKRDDVSRLFSKYVVQNTTILGSTMILPRRLSQIIWEHFFEKDWYLQ